MEASQRRGGGGMVPISPSQTPRSSDRVVRDPRSGEGNFSGKHDKDRGVNVQVIVRCRPLSEDEARFHTPVVISCNDSRREVCAVQSIANKQIDRTFLFDKVFGPSSQQKDLYDQAVCPIVFEVLEGYTSTIFAYGQTGTGKTYTMEGGSRKKNGDIPSDAGVIPRAVRQIFDILEAQNAEYSLKVTFLELYNEEITDLLAPEECSKFIEDKSKKPIALMEDGKGGVFVRGLEEEIVTTADEIYKILEKGSAKRRTAETLLNKQSSRSHSVFSITIHIKECTPEGEEMIKCGKLNLVDLAGSENISRSGAREGRAREAGEINKSLLTLGRVINALVEHSGHIPYRDSKLTRLLRDSLGGKTKTCIIATISPSIHCLEETLSTLDYAHRAKNIKNKPEVNQKMMKSALIKDLYFEIDRLKQEVHAAREKNGIYVPKDRYLQDEAEKKVMLEKIEHMEIDIETKDKKLLELQDLYSSEQQLAVQLSDKLEISEKRLRETECALLDLEERHRQANATIKEKDYLISNLLKSEKALTEHALGLREELETAASDVSNLFAKIERKDKIEDNNRVLIQKFQSELAQQLEILHKAVASATTQQEHHLKEMEEDMHLFVSSKIEATEQLQDHLEKLKTMYGLGIKALEDLARELDGNSRSIFADLNTEVSKHSSDLEKLFKGIVTEANNVLHDLQESLHIQETKLTTYAQQQHEAHCRAVETTRSISQITVNFFKTVDGHASKLGEIVEESQTVTDHKLSDLEKKFEECAAMEERQLLTEMAELLAGSNARKKKLIQGAINELRESAASRTNKLQQEMSIMQSSTSSIKAEWTSYSERAESHYLKNTDLVERGKKEMKDVIQKGLNQAKLSAQQWRNARDSLLDQQKSNVISVHEIVRGGMDMVEELRGRYSCAVSSALEDAEVGSKNMLSSIDCSLQLDREACETLDSIINPCCDELRQLNSGHHHKIAEITQNAGKCLLEDYKMDLPSCSTPRRRSMKVPSIAFIENLKTTCLEMSKQANGDVKHVAARLPFTAIN
ncbi:kinesin-like protein KIN-5D [Salvia hispanica]|uniref:kinesin-like protein KIN-5D n=1 Tax=Salvia hispanica TaxID=49212 RepID=UPI0020094863|nr:kinesin-like protein KIN-5D [Salvia hispanica]